MQTGEMNAAVALTRLTSSSPDSHGSHDEEFAGTEGKGENENTASVAVAPPTIDTPKNFPQMLMEILNDKENEDSISWLPHGCSFRINKREKFLNEVLPRYYKKTVKYTSFTRKLSRWDFVRLSSGPDTGAFYHKLFQRDNPKLVKKMFCKGERPQFIRSMPPHSSFGLPFSSSLGLSPYSLAYAQGMGMSLDGATGIPPSYLTPSLRASMLLQNPTLSAYGHLAGSGGLSGVDVLGPSLGATYTEMESRRMIDSAMRANALSQDILASKIDTTSSPYQFQATLARKSSPGNPGVKGAWAA